jgi:membrane-bound lytic murein transglycosylase D
MTSMKKYFDSPPAIEYYNDISISIYFINTLFRSYNSIGTLSNSLLKYGNHFSISKLFYPRRALTSITILKLDLFNRVQFPLLMAIVRPAVAVAAKLIAPAVGSSAIPQSSFSNAHAVTRSDATALFNSRSSDRGLLKPVTANSPELPLLDVNFCGECLPFEQTDVVNRWKHVFTLFRSSTSDLGRLRERADKFFPIIEPIMEKYAIPDDFRYIPMAESDLRTRAVSSAGAAGYWQLMPGTARELGLKVGGRNDERFDAKKSTEAACKHLRDLYKQFGSWSLVAAAYNAGSGYVKSQLRHRKGSNYYSMKLPRETRYYLFRVLVYKEVMSRPDDYSSFLWPGSGLKTAYVHLPGTGLGHFS